MEREVMQEVNIRNTKSTQTKDKLLPECYLLPKIHVSIYLIIS